MTVKNVILKDHLGSDIYPRTSMKNVLGLLEHVETVGDIQELKTDVKENVVKSINELVDEIVELKAMAGDESAIEEAIAKLEQKIMGELSKYVEITVFNAFIEKVGDVEELKTESKESIVSAINEIFESLEVIEVIESSIEDIEAEIKKIGDLESLNTEAKTDLVSALNEVLSKEVKIEDIDGLKTELDKIGDLGKLKTKSKEELVGSINELVDEKTALKEQVKELEAKTLYFVEIEEEIEEE